MRGPSDNVAKDDPASLENSRVGRLKRRADFLAAAKGRRWHGKALTLQAAPREAPGGPRIGFTLTKKVGCSVVRNRARRRLREAVRHLDERPGELPLRAAHDYVVIGRLEAIRMPFEALKTELARAMRAVHDGGGATARGAGRTTIDRNSVRRAAPKRAGLERTGPQS